MRPLFPGSHCEQCFLDELLHGKPYFTMDRDGRHHHLNPERIRQVRADAESLRTPKRTPEGDREASTG